MKNTKVLPNSPADLVLGETLSPIHHFAQGPDHFAPNTAAESNWKFHAQRYPSSGQDCIRHCLGVKFPQAQEERIASANVVGACTRCKPRYCRTADVRPFTPMS